ncbi:MAG: (2Fe-2S)-binding protein [Thalassococcus sp.]|uniref:(2Fe-2S)-binding protein n=1 Tax=Thalassococcus sp. TaxID=1928858 RepID=UPI001B20BE9B|nr:2Fe-2S iron-sulfur cluster-binding protein [Thalassococcus sp.]MBO6865988.1 (2Fe-2S)-binding protein [Thalassococcus sp.]
MATFTVNGQDVTVDMTDDTPLLWALRDRLNMTGTKFGCGVAQCGACTVMVDGSPRRSCVTPLGSIDGAEIETIEAVEGPEAQAVQEAWVDIAVPQCGWCQSGQIMSATALLRLNPTPTDEDIDRALAGNLCRCATYVRIRKAIHAAAKSLEG